MNTCEGAHQLVVQINKSIPKMYIQVILYGLNILYLEIYVTIYLCIHIYTNAYMYATTADKKEAINLKESVEGYI